MSGGYKKKQNFNFGYTTDDPDGSVGKFIGLKISDAIGGQKKAQPKENSIDYGAILDAEQPTTLHTGGEPTAEPEKPEHQVYYDMRDEYLDEYLNREGFKYNVDADEIYKGYQKQIQADADRARRQTAAQAASLTGGYGSSYASAMGQAAYDDTMDGLDDVRTSLYEAAYNRYQNEGQELLAKAELAGARGDLEYQKTDEYKKAVEAALYYSDEAVEQRAAAAAEAAAAADKQYAIEQALMTTQGLYDFRGKNNTGATWYNEALRIYAGYDATGKVKDKFLGEHEEYTREQIINDLITWEDKDGNKMTSDMAEYMADTVMLQRDIMRFSSMVGSDGASLADYVEELQASGKDGAAVAELLAKWRDKDGHGLSDEDINIILASL